MYVFYISLIFSTSILAITYLVDWYSEEIVAEKQKIVADRK